MNHSVKIRSEIRKNLLTNYAVAQRMGISISGFYVKLQKPMTDKEAEPFYRTIRELAAERMQ